MNNEAFMFLTLDAVRFFGTPYFDGQQWNNLQLGDGEIRVYLTETRASILKFPVGRNEEPIAYIHSIYGIGEESYIPVYDRTNLVPIEKLYPNEIIN
ncbi:hypothetical protein ACWE42_11085 [Sutcliffiella cohnii]